MSKEQGRGAPPAQPSRNGADELANGLGWFSIGLGVAEVAAPGKIAERIGVRFESSEPRAALREARSTRFPATRLHIHPAGRGSMRMPAPAAISRAAATALDVLSVRQLSQSPKQAAASKRDSGRVTKTIIVIRAAADVYRLWRAFENLPACVRLPAAPSEPVSPSSSAPSRGGNSRPIMRSDASIHRGMHAAQPPSRPLELSRI